MQEIERKFLVKHTDFLDEIEGVELTQGYLTKGSDNTVRIRIAGTKAFITIKSKVVGISRFEYEYEIPITDAREMLNLCEYSLISKKRYTAEFDGHTWEIDIFEGDNEGLVIAEIELKSEAEQFVKPQWLGEEVSQDKRYFNSNLSKTPFKNW